MDRRWLIPLVLSLALAARTVLSASMAVLDGLPRGYGEGAVAHAGQILARGGDPYAATGGFVSANYPPLAYAFAALGSAIGPFIGLRLADLVAALAIAAAVAWVARTDRIVALTLGASFLALYPVASWLPQARVDMLAVALTFAAVVALRSQRAPLLFAVLAALAVTAKPTAAVPLVVVFGYALWRDRARAVSVVAASAIAMVVALGVLLVRFDARGLYTHLVTYNAFPYDARNLLPFVAFGTLLLGAFVALAVRCRDGYARAYLVGSLGVVALVGHEGATLNYLLDLAAACCFALALMARDMGRWTTPAIAGQLFGTLVLSVAGPFALQPGTAERDAVALLSPMPRDGVYYAEDSAPLIASGLEPYVDDAYVWARLVALGARADDVTPLVERRAFTAIVSEAPLDALASGPAYRIQRWPAAVVDAILREYALGPSVPGAYVYLPRR